MIQTIGGHFARMAGVRNVIAVIEPNTSEITFFGEGTELDASKWNFIG